MTIRVTGGSLHGKNVCTDMNGVCLIWKSSGNEIYNLRVECT